MTVRPLQGRVVIRGVRPVEGTAAGSFGPDAPRNRPLEGDVVAAGWGLRYASGVLQAHEIKAGDRVLFGKGAGERIKRDGEDLMIMREADVVGIYRATAQKLAA
jgi:chaperonin GroES